MAKNKIYPFAVASVRSMENKLLTKQKLMQMADAKDAAEALRILCETDYGKTQIEDIHDFEKMIQNHLEEEYQAVGKLIPSETFMDIFRFKNDYHNIKVLIKEEISKVNGKKYLIQGGSIPLDILHEISDFDHVAVMLSPQSMSVERFFDRADPEKQFLLNVIDSCDDPAAVMENYRLGLARINSQEHYDEYAVLDGSKLDVDEPLREELLLSFPKKVDR